MQRIFPNLYRIDLGPRGPDNRMSHSYLLVRKGGNLLVCNFHRGSSIMDHADEIDKLGGIDAQFVPHFHDAKRGTLHQELYDRFGCELCYHEEERKTIRTKTKCPEREFGHDGLKLGSDFQAHYFPGHTPGMSVLTWKHRGKCFLFPSHVVGLENGGWRVSFAPHLIPKQKSRFMELAKMDVDYWMRGGSNDEREEYHALNASEQKALRKTLRDRISPRKSKSSKPRIATGFAPVLRMLKETPQFDISTVPSYNTCKIDTIENYLAVADVTFFLSSPRSLPSGHEFHSKLRDYVEKGGGLLIGDCRPKSNKNWIINTHPFPEIVSTATAASGFVKGASQDLIVEKKHPALGNMKKQTRYSTESEVGLALQPGEKGTVLIRNSHDEPVCVGGQIGKGRVVLTGFNHHNKMDFADEERKLIPAIVHWLAGKG
jgi:hypothetical protein